VLAEWIEEHRSLGWTPGDPLFCSTTGRPITQAYIRRRLPELARAAEIHKRVHAHGLRHTPAAELRVEGVDVAVIQRQLGHRSLLTTIGYLNHLDCRDSLLSLSLRSMDWAPITRPPCGIQLPGLDDRHSLWRPGTIAITVLRTSRRN
jgi:integrase